MLPVPHVPDGLTIALIRRSAERQGTEAIMPDNGQVERMNRTIKDATVERYPYDTHDQLGPTCSSSWMPTTMLVG